ncbi:hypothetical protein OH779_38875 [Actinacidiphila glaucinigra]|uniref:hypothetical protein n=1 Tax=Actinacidiphila glaucinigra TaxID=235986 RepID=UPI00386C57FC
MNTESEECRLEAQVLAELAIAAGADEYPQLTKVVDDARAVTVGALDQPPDLTEQELDRIAVALRRAILRRAHECADEHFRSPEHGVAKVLPSGARLHHSYERGATAEHLEERIARNAGNAAGWASEHVVFSSAMGAMSALLQCYRAMTQPTHDAPLRLGAWSSYFETDMLLELCRGETTGWESLDDLYGATASGRYQALLVEPVRYDWDASVMDIAAFVRAWRSAAPRPRTLILDNTLASFTWPTERFLSALPDGLPHLVVEVRSGLKLDQQGLELANAGVVSVYSCHENAGTPSAGQFAAYLRTARALGGTAPSVDGLAAMDTAFVFDRGWTARHAGQVFLHNKALAEAVSGHGGLFSRIAHPSLHGSPPLRHGPFVVCRLADDTIENHGLLLAVINEEVRRQRLLLTWGSSFGFRGHRYETILPRVSERRGLFKVAMGSRGGPSLRATLEMMCRLAAYPDFAALRRDYPDVRPVDLMRMAGQGQE